MQDQTIRRLANGSIDYNHYLRKGRRCRAEAQRELFKGRRGIVGPLVALAVIFAPLAVAALLHELNDNSGIAGTSRPSVTAIDGNVRGLNRARASWGDGQRSRGILVAGH